MFIVQIWKGISFLVLILWHSAQSEINKPTAVKIKTIDISRCSDVIYEFCFRKKVKRMLSKLVDIKCKEEKTATVIAKIR